MLMETPARGGEVSAGVHERVPLWVKSGGMAGVFLNRPKAASLSHRRMAEGCTRNDIFCERFQVMLARDRFPFHKVLRVKVFLCQLLMGT